MSRKYFGTDGVRGPYGGPVINEDFAARLGFAVAAWLPQKGRVLIGRDTRASGESLERAVAAGLAAGGCTPVSLGVVPTPAVARAVRAEDAALGVVITASHNPAADNGIKFFGPSGIKLTDEDELGIEKKLVEDAARPVTFHTRNGTCWRPHVKSVVRHQNSIYSQWRFEDVWIDKYPHDKARRRVGSNSHCPVDPTSLACATR